MEVVIVRKLPKLPNVNQSILFWSDPHLPFVHRDTLRFLARVKKLYHPTMVICGGDETDNAAASFHDNDPDAPYTAGTELKAAIKQFQPFFKLFPKCEILDSNHGSMAIRRAKASGMPMSFIKSNKEIIGAPDGWEWHDEIILTLPTGRKCLFTHSIGANYFQASKDRGMSLVQGHHHSKFGVQFWGTPERLHFAANVGCLFDYKSMMFHYNKTQAKRPLLGVLMIIDGMPVPIPMIMNEKGRWVGAKS